jgi:hypothetical protein
VSENGVLGYIFSLMTKGKLTVPVILLALICGMIAWLKKRFEKSNGNDFDYLCFIEKAIKYAIYS